MHRIFVVPVIGCLFLTLSAPAAAQSFLTQSKGSGSVSVEFGTVYAAGHFLDDGTKLPGAQTRANHVTLSTEYGLTDKFTVGLSLPYIRSKYSGVEEPLNLPFNRLDDGAYHGSFQDFRLEGRYNVLARPFFATPFFAASIPSHHYETIGEAAVGPDLTQFTMGVGAGRLLNPVLSQAIVYGSYAYTKSEKVLDMSLDRSNVDLGVGYFVTPTISATFLWRRQWMHGGLGFEQLYQSSPDVFLLGDRLTRQDFQHVGVGGGYSINDKLGVDFTFVKFVSGHNAHYGEGISAGLTWSFSRESLIQ